MPLMAFIGENSRRSVKALEVREQAMVRRDWGPGSMWRSEHMQRLGKGPPPAKRGWSDGHAESSSSQWWTQGDGTRDRRDR